ncbi:hypothetical protein H9660_09815 [Clostridium sp. Sa3CUN1]|uniref:Uncharacterized protein n=1 Tax=Clostridium gallinarum TaxID=2762246 RepID=A0ABR8Q4S9_9CLOT|nr:hypothetical protein [Clostridium gallinarum]MBD7915442.1 hypothetical protein [Clostridium gallinarum]
MERNENKIIFREIKNYEEAYYYNSNPESRSKYNNEPKNNRKNSKFKKSFLELLGFIFEGTLEIIFSILE